MAKTLEPTSTLTAVTPAKPWLTAADMRLLEAACETLIPALETPAADDPHGFLRRPASAMQVAQGIAETLGAEDAETRADFRQLLGILRSPAGGLLLVGRPIGFMQMKPDLRERALRNMANSNVAKLRQGFQAMKRLAAFIFYAAPAPDGGDNPNWAAIGFAPPPPAPTIPKPIQPLAITSDTTLEADAVVVGSGAGGGVVAAELAAAGKSVIVLEKGGYYNEADFSGREAEMMPKVYLKRGLLATRDLSMAILAGSCLGGGTVVNWSTSFRIPDYVAQEWEHDYGLQGITGNAFARHYDAVALRMGVNVEDSAPNANNAVLEQGCAKLGYEWGVIARNANHCEQRCGNCPYGCAYSRKQSTLLTFLQDAADRGARFVVNCSVERVTMAQGAATGVIATVIDPATGAQHRVTVRAKTVIIAAGSIHSPAILLRSGLTSPHLGRNLHLHPVAAVTGFYPDPIRTWEGSLQTRYSDHFGHPADGYGFKFEVAPGHPGLMAQSLPWASGRQHKEDMQQLSHAAALIVLVRDKNGGRVTLDKHGEPVVDYPLGDHERRQLTLGTQEGVKVLLAAGANRVGTLHAKRTDFYPPATGDALNAPELSAFLREVEERGLEPNRVLLFSAHQMGSCRMAADPRRGVIGDDNQVFGVKGLFVADGSVFPTASGVNPMLTILALAHRASGAIKATM
jgi:choline dehydrogenase-like flavoprotein